MAIIDIDRMYWEMEQTMLNNFSGTPEHKYTQAKKQFLESVEETIEANKESLIKGVDE